MSLRTLCLMFKHYTREKGDFCCKSQRYKRMRRSRITGISRNAEMKIQVCIVLTSGPCRYLYAYLRPKKRGFRAPI